MSKPVFVPYTDRHSPLVSPEEALRAFYEVMRKRRSIRHFSDAPVPLSVIESLVRIAGSAPSGANKQPWRFIAVRDPALKRRIRVAAEHEEREFYAHRASDEWLADLEPLGTDPTKEFLEIAPWILVVFKLVKAEDESLVYYVNESVGLACGFLLAAAQHAGLATLTHTPNPMAFLSEVLERPKNEKPYLLIPIGYPTPNCVVPEAAIARKPLSEILQVR
ncbi:MAG: nitroreductase family protein [Planctomycetes bacterium]|nr:nitroreductase family protein [Planctomycetota bacterium]